MVHRVSLRTSTYNVVIYISHTYQRGHSVRRRPNGWVECPIPFHRKLNYSPQRNEFVRLMSHHRATINKCLPGILYLLGHFCGTRRIFDNVDGFEHYSPFMHSPMRLISFSALLFIHSESIEWPKCKWRTYERGWPSNRCTEFFGQRIFVSLVLRWRHDKQHTLWMLYQRYFNHISRDP